MAIRLSHSTLRFNRLLGLLLLASCVYIYPACDADAPDEDYIELNPSEATLMVGQSITLMPVTDVGLGMDEALEWSSGQPAVASVDQDGVVLGLTPGTATITAVVLDVTDPDMAREVDSAMAVITVVPAMADGDDVIEAGTYTTCSSPEAVNLIDDCDLVGGTADAFGDLAGGCLASISCADGYRVLDLTTQETVFEKEGLSNGVGAAFGTIGVEDGANAALFTFGTDGTIFCPTQEDGFCQLTVNATTYDATPAGGDPGTGEAVLVGPSRGVQFIAPVADGFGFGFRKESIPPGAFQGEPVSAWMPSTGGRALRTGGTAPLLVLDRGQNSFLYEVEGPTPNAFPLGVGLDARRLRCAEVGNGSVFCGISVFGDDRVALVLWTIANSPTSRGFIDVGDGPVGLDIVALPSGTFAIVVANFNDGTITEMEVSASATPALISSETRAVSGDCTNPGHAAYVEDGEGMKVVYTCYGSDRYVVEESRF